MGKIVSFCICFPTIEPLQNICFQKFPYYFPPTFKYGRKIIYSTRMFIFFTFTCQLKISDVRCPTVLNLKIFYRQIIAKLQQNAYQMILFQKIVFFSPELRIFCRNPRNLNFGNFIKNLLKIFFSRKKTLSSFLKVS